MPSRNRIPATIQMVQGEDDDLIAWYTALPKGERHQILKDAVRAGLGIVVRSDNHREERIDADQLEALWQELRHEWATWTQELVESLPNYVQASVEQTINVEATQSHKVEGSPALSSKEVDQRKVKLKKARW
jgi:hypothetical protein